MEELKSNIFVKLGLIGVLVMLLLIPSTFIQNLIDERQSSRQEAVNEVSSKQGGSQTITGPFLSVPFNKLKPFNSSSSKTGSRGKANFIHFMPDELNIESEVIPEKKYRGLFEIVTYEAKTKITGFFKQPKDFLVDEKRNSVDLDGAVINVGISDLKGMQKQTHLNWNSNKIEFEPSLSNKDIAFSGISAPIQFDEEKEIYTFEIDLELKGTNSLLYVPLGKQTTAKMNSTWPDPKLTGSVVSNSVQTSEEGFYADWNVLDVNRNFPQAWIGNAHKVKHSSFGAEFMIAVDNYTRSTRVAKYAILFIALTFLTFFFVEILKKVFIHPIQYFLVGFALIIFYTLLLSIGEHLAFNWAYIIAAGMTIALISLYTRAILKSVQLSLMLFTLLVILYTFIFVIIQMETYALLIGSIAIFVILACIMFFTRNIDWYGLKLGKEKIPDVQ